MQPVTNTHSSEALAAQPSTGAPDTVETRLWIEEHAWLYGVLKSPANQAPTFRLPDLISACVTAVLTPPEGYRALFAYLGTQLVLRDPATARRREAMWRAQYEQLQDVQRSPANQHPNPKFQLDQLTTAAVALCREADPSGALVLKYARLNMASRAKHRSSEASA
ncbi:hypothetical protein BA022_09050 [Diaphorobacter nitroreducens]|uniref:hypothetical protein n=1 Tax=Diaphorobacter nitroreducens TaxID=164759 RepID=UPI000B598D02|nr:hypothetical protein [Diaphorobacter nitroreducens]ASI68672.1 hypothetical protein BA022_09050 [Diaphorobacter nitroreducens]